MQPIFTTENSNFGKLKILKHANRYIGILNTHTHTSLKSEILENSYI